MRAGALGDLLLLRRTIAALQHARHTVGLLAPSGPASALIGPGTGDVTEVLPFESAVFGGLLVDGVEDARTAERLRGYGAAITYTRNATLARNLGRVVPMVLQHDPAPPADGPHASEWLAACLPALGVDSAEDPLPILTPSADDQRRARAIVAELPPRFLAVHPGSGSPAKNWPAARFAALVRVLEPARWLLVRGPADEAAADELARVPGASVARELPLRVLAALLARAGAYVGNDSGVTHLAAASGAPTIALFGKTDPRLWAPVGPRVEVIGGAAMEGIAVDAVATAVVRTMSGARGLPSG